MRGNGIIWSGWKKMKNVSMPSLKSSLRADSPEGAVLSAAERISKEAPEGLADMPEGALAGNMISIPGDVADRLRWRLLPPKNIANEVPKEIFALLSGRASGSKGCCQIQ